MQRSFVKKVPQLAAMSFATASSVLLILGLGTSNVQANQRPKMPWPSSSTGIVSQTMHGSRGRALDIALPAGTPVLAPENVQVVWQCVAQGSRNHRAIKLRSSQGSEYWLIHVSADGLKSSYTQGEQIGVVAADTPNDPNCAISRDVHLHMELPSSPFTMDGQELSRRTALYAKLYSTNQANPDATNQANPADSSSLLELRAAPPGGEKYCLEVNGTKIGTLPDATNAKVGRCRPIQEQQFRLIDDGNGFRRLELKAAPSGNEKYCLEVNGTKIGTLPDAANAKVGRCRPIQEQQFQLR